MASAMIPVSELVVPLTSRTTGPAANPAGRPGDGWQPARVGPAPGLSEGGRLVLAPEGQRAPPPRAAGRVYKTSLVYDSRACGVARTKRRGRYDGEGRSDVFAGRPRFGKRGGPRGRRPAAGADVGRPPPLVLRGAEALQLRL